MSRQMVDQGRARQAAEAVKTEGETINSILTKFGITSTLIANRVASRVAVANRPGPQRVLTVKKEVGIEDLLVYVDRHRLGITTQQRGESVQTLCNEGRSMPWNPPKGLGKACFTAFFKSHPRLAPRSSRIYEANRVSADAQTRLDIFTKTSKEFYNNVQPEATDIWNTDEPGNYPFRFATLVFFVSPLLPLSPLT